MKAIISYVSETHYGSGKKGRLEEINTLEDLIKLRDTEQEDIIINRSKPTDADISIEIFDDYYE